MKRSCQGAKRPSLTACTRSIQVTGSLLPAATASAARRCGHSISTGGMASRSGPGKSPGVPMPDSAIASSATMAPIASVSAGAEGSSTDTKSTVPAMVVRRWAIGKRLMRRMPETPSSSLRQFSAWPWPSEVSTPMPVTTTTGRPDDRGLRPRCDSWSGAGNVSRLRRERSRRARRERGT